MGLTTVVTIAMTTMAEYCFESSVNVQFPKAPIDVIASRLEL
jgi:hypothetical protein